MTISLMTSTDGQTWTGQEVLGEGWMQVAKGSNWVIAGFGDTSVKIATSDDGLTWTDRGEVGGDFPYDMAYGNGRFVILATDISLVSTNGGITWNTFPRLDGGGRLAFGGGVFIDLGWSNELGAVAYRLSTDGEFWSTYESTEIQYSWNSFKFINNIFVAVGDDATNLYVSKNDGLFWTTAQVPTANAIQSYIAYNAGSYVLVTGVGQSFTSPDLETWTPAGFLGQPANTLWSGLEFGAGRFVAISDHGHVMTSTNGASWATQTSALAAHRLEDIGFV